MKIKRKKLFLITDILLICIFCCVFSISFFTDKIVPISIYGQKSYQALYAGDKNSDKISLMFNVYENTDVVNSIIDVLNENNVKATFFVGGCWADDNEKTLKRIIETGNEIANHGYFHKDHAYLNYEKNREEIYNTGKVVETLCGIKPVLFAPPSGSFSATTLEVAEALGYKTIMWSKDTIDWRDKDKNKIIKRATEKAAGGDFILMHPKPQTLSSLPTIIETLKSKNFNLVTVSENISTLVENYN